jgi:two-component system chemotaxis response regulator CheV
METSTKDARIELEEQDLIDNKKMEILLFNLGSEELFGINVSKVREVSATPAITRAPNMHANIEGLISLRGNVIPVLSLRRAIGLLGVKEEDQSRSMMVTEFNKRTLGFLVREVDRILQVPWDKIRPPGSVNAYSDAPITAISELPDGRLISLLDAETILAQTFGEPVVSGIGGMENGHLKTVFFVDDSPIARKKIQETLEAMGVKFKMALNGREAWERLRDIATIAATHGKQVRDEIDLILCDAEMPEMDGYQLTKKIKSDPRFSGVPVVMHSSLSSEANRTMGTKVGVDSYVPKFDAEALSDTMRPLLVKA